MEHIRAVELDGRGQEKQSPLTSGGIAGPHRLHHEGLGGIIAFYQTHKNDAENKSRNCDDDGECESTEKCALFTGLH